ncbi:UNVERIFIED_CONTAM: hypothetical protein PYX00_003902 [Menopon gallinae]|uniref:26S proteasome non-ATPase regulatory subunit 10 n=1 Tax=Menopon gallinae TaxID=328185 RepID=A0AAW2I3S1_9NEOP
MINFQESIYDLAYKGAIDEVKAKVSENPDLVTSKDGNERMLIHWASLSGCDQLVKFLLEQGSPVDPPDDIAMTPLILAASANRSQVVKLLIDNGANVNAQNNEGHSALQYSASKGWTQVLEMLILHGADINIMDKRKATPLHRAASRGDLPVVTLLVKHGGKGLMINAVDVYGNTPLHLACEENNVPVVELLVEIGANIELKNKEEKTPLELARPELVKCINRVLGKEN